MDDAITPPERWWVIVTRNGGEPIALAPLYPTHAHALAVVESWAPEPQGEVWVAELKLGVANGI